MNALLGWGLAVAAVAAGYTAYGWPGVLLAVSVVVFWLLLQFSRAVRLMQTAAGRPVGQVPSAVMLQSQMRQGLRLPQILQLTRSLGTQLAREPEVWAWRDEGGDELRVEMLGGRVERWDLHRARPPEAGAAELKSPTPD
ncbi:conserved hypothetical protein [Rubrivivax sp. A210]|uniref:hypothetical protein n=1 Tax=Rubrivivax sp. A210 TaxID=2772301 RepID=UPI001919D4EA|nr:hypothetical protein [Rubrivivax sp. A210]CAD5370225.1 conserved hypothetical protein [Rubrivivax sp. A210]